MFLILPGKQTNGILKTIQKQALLMAKNIWRAQSQIGKYKQKIEEIKRLRTYIVGEKVRK